MYNSEGNQQLYSAQGSPQVYTPNGTKYPYKTNQLSTQMYSAQGTPQNIEKFQNERPAFVSEDSRYKYWAERSARGFPVGASIMENKVREKNAWVANDPAFDTIEKYPMPPSDDAHVLHDGNMRYNYRASTQRENKILETPSKMVGERANNVANKGCFYTVNGEISCSK